MITKNKKHFKADPSPELVEEIILEEDTNTDKGTKTDGFQPDPKKTGGGNEAGNKRNEKLYYVFLAVLISLATVTFVNVLITYNFFNKYSLSDLKSLSLKDIF